MRVLLLYTILLLLILPFGAVPFIITSIILFLAAYLESRDKKFLVGPLVALISFLWLPLAVVAVLTMIYLSDEEPFIKATTLIASLTVVFILFPIVYLFVSAPPWGFPSQLYLTLITSIVAATSATLIGIFLALPLSYILARKNFPGKGFVEGAVDLPIVIPHTVAGIVLLIVFGSAGIIGAPLEKIGVRFYYALPGIILAMLFVSIPFLINQLREGIEKVDERYELVAMSLGASRTRAFFTVVLPQIKRNILAGSINSWARAMSEFGAVIMIAFYPMIAPTYIYFLFTNYGLNAALPATSFILLVTLTIFITLRVLFGRVKNAGN
ncbi:MAG: ABC transporter permease [Euryarchaeota archaeon]|nr:ABC transporter permease [Euryarchaeota archaeon]